MLQKERRDTYWPDCPWVFFHHATGQRIKSFRTAWDGAVKRAGITTTNGKPCITTCGAPQ